MAFLDLNDKPPPRNLLALKLGLAAAGWIVTFVFLRWTGLLSSDSSYQTATATAVAAFVSTLVSARHRLSFGRPGVRQPRPYSSLGTFVDDAHKDTRAGTLVRFGVFFTGVTLFMVFCGVVNHREGNGMAAGSFAMALFMALLACASFYTLWRRRKHRG